MASSVEEDIQKIAVLVIREHGERAAFFASSRVDKFLTEGEPAGAAIWRLVSKEIERLQGMKPEGGLN